MVDGLGHGVVGHVVGGCFGAEQKVIADVLLDEPLAIVAADDRVGEIQILDHGLQPATIAFRDLTTEDHRDLVRLADGAGVEQTFA